MIRPNPKFVMLGVVFAFMTTQPRAQTASIQADFLKDWSGLKDVMMKIADAMPPDKYSFKATPAERDYGQQVMHVAQTNILILKSMGDKAVTPVIVENANSKTDTMKAMAESFDYGIAILKNQTDRTMVESVNAPYLGQSTRARIFEFLVGHTQDVYGQMAVYLRLSGLVPPASQRP